MGYRKKYEAPIIVNHGAVDIILLDSMKLRGLANDTKE
jgi:hypothetical protein